MVIDAPPHWLEITEQVLAHSLANQLRSRLQSCNCFTNWANTPRTIAFCQRWFELRSFMISFANRTTGLGHFEKQRKSSVFTSFSYQRKKCFADGVLRNQCRVPENDKNLAVFRVNPMVLSFIFNDWHQSPLSRRVWDRIRHGRRKSQFILSDATYNQINRRNGVYTIAPDPRQLSAQAPVVPTARAAYTRGYPVRRRTTD